MRKVKKLRIKDIPQMIDISINAYPGFNYPDFTVFNTDILNDNQRGYKAAGFFGQDWSLKSGEYYIEKK